MLVAYMRMLIGPCQGHRRRRKVSPSTASLRAYCGMRGTELASSTESMYLPTRLLLMCGTDLGLRVPNPPGVKTGWCYLLSEVLRARLVMSGPRFQDTADL